MILRFISFLTTLYRNRHMIKSFALADLKKQYAGSYGGMFWTVAQPLFLMATYYIVFGFMFARKFNEYGTTSFALFLICGMVPWLYFNTVVSRSSSVLLDNKALVTRTIFPSEIIPICLLVSGFINHLIGMAILLIFAVAVTGGLTPYSIFIIPYFLLMSLMILGVSWVLASLNVFMRDIGQIVSIVLNIWFYFTPIFYPPGIIPDRFRALIVLNPMAVVVDGYRNSLIASRYPDPYKLLYLAGFSAALFVIGGAVYKKLKPAFVDVL